MAKRKAGVNDIIYELDNEDLTGSSDDERKAPKTKILKPSATVISSELVSIETKNVIENSNTQLKNCNQHKYVIEMPSSNGGKNKITQITNSASNNEMSDECSNHRNVLNKVESSGVDKTIIFNEDIRIDSPASSSDLGVVGCVNKTPLVSVRFRDKTLANKIKSKIKKFMIDLIKLHENDSSAFESDTDVELDVWPEDLEELVEQKPKCDDNLFFIDTDPTTCNVDVPVYKQAEPLLSNVVENKDDVEKTPQRFTCFNCDGDHQLKDCKKPRNHARVAEKRRNLSVKLGRYHVEDDQKYGHLIPGRISGQLRHALGLKPYELPLHIYKMRVLGYPCGWMEEARIMPSGITMFDSTGSRVLDPDEEDGEVCEPGSKDMYDIKKILDFPGFNVPASSKYREQAHLYGLPPMSDQDSKILMLQRLAPNAMKAYKRKKLSLFPSSANNSQEGVAEMELDSGDEVPEFPSVPPLPDDEPPKPPSPPPPPPGSPPKVPPPTESPPKNPSSPKENNSSKAKMTKPQSIAKLQKEDNDSDNKSDLEIIEVLQVPDIPVPEDELITIDEDDDISILSSGRDSPSIDYLEAKKRQLLDAIKSAEIATDSGTDTELTKEVILSDDKSQDVSIASIDESILLESDKEAEKDYSDKIVKDENAAPIENLDPNKTNIDDETAAETTIHKNEIIIKPSKQDIVEEIEDSQSSTSVSAVEDIPKSLETNTPETKTGKVKTTLIGAPVLNIVSPFVKLPSDDKFAKDICDVINFENLPNSTGKYKQISSLLKKVKSEVERIQES